jgi:hypothetical protein
MFSRHEIKIRFAPLKTDTAAAVTGWAMFNLADIHRDDGVCLKYIEQLKSVLPCSFEELVGHARRLCPELAALKSLKDVTPTDKGGFGKKVECYIFGRHPNSDSAPDLALRDVKATVFKKLQCGGFNAKERVTLTNCTDYEHIKAHAALEDTKYYTKIRRGVLVVFADECVRVIEPYDIEQLPGSMREVLKTDYQQIRTCVSSGALTQKGQEYLHIHPHGCKGSVTRAFGFKPKFVTHLVAALTLRVVKTRGRKIHYLVF